MPHGWVASLALRPASDEETHRDARPHRRDRGGRPAGSAARRLPRAVRGGRRHPAGRSRRTARASRWREPETFWRTLLDLVGAARSPVRRTSSSPGTTSDRPLLPRRPPELRRGPAPAAARTWTTTGRRSPRCTPTGPPSGTPGAGCGPRCGAPRRRWPPPACARATAWCSSRPNRAATVVVALAAAALGAAVSTATPDMGAAALLGRFQQVDPALLVLDRAGDAGRDGGRARRRADHACSGCCCWTTSRCRRWTCATDRLAELTAAADPDEARSGCAGPFDTPLFVMFSSGTTGPPKAMVHGAGGTLLEHVKEHRLHGDLRPDDVLYFHTTTAWMMWNWQLSALAVGAHVVLYDGPVAGPEALWELVAEHGVTVFGTSPAYLQLCQDADYRPRRRAGPDRRLRADALDRRGAARLAVRLGRRRGGRRSRCSRSPAARTSSAASCSGSPELTGPPRPLPDPEPGPGRRRGRRGRPRGRRARSASWSAAIPSRPGRSASSATPTGPGSTPPTSPSTRACGRTAT